MATSNIEWTDATWNPTTGCTKISPGCKHCYAETMHARLTAMGQKKYAKPFRVVQPWEDDLGAPLRWRKPRRVFVNSMSDLFHESVPDEYIAAVFGVMAATPQHTYQVLTKRADRLPRWFQWISAQRGVGCIEAADKIIGLAQHRPPPYPPPWPLPNVWIGVSIENQDYADRMLDLVRIPAAVRFLSCEPLIGPLALGLLGTLPKDLGLGYRGFYEFIHWVIVGGESGHGARPCAIEWVKRIVAECKEVEIPVFVKQLGTAPLLGPGDAQGLRAEVTGKLRNRKGGDPAEWPDELRVREWPEVQS